MLVKGAPDSTKPLPEPMFTHHQWSPVPMKFATLQKVLQTELS